MPAQYPGIGYVADSEVSLLRKICNNTALIADSGGGGGGAVTQLIAGSNISLSPPTGVGAVTISASGAGGGVNGYPTPLTVTGQATLSTGDVRTCTYKLTISGTAGARDINMNPNTGLGGVLHTAGDKLRLDITFAAVAGLVVTVWQTNSQLVKLLPAEVFGAGQTFTTDGNILSACWDFVFDGAAWQYEMSNLPA